MILKYSALKHAYFLFVQEAPFSSLNIFLCQSGEINSVKFLNLVAHSLEHPAYDTVLSRVELDSYLTFIIGVSI